MSKYRIKIQFVNSSIDFKTDCDNAEKSIVEALENDKILALPVDDSNIYMQTKNVLFVEVLKTEDTQ